MPKFKEPLSPKQKLFIDQYLIDRNATEAALRAGYSKKIAHVQGSVNLKNPLIKQLINAREAEIHEKMQISQEWVRRNLKRMALKNSKTVTSYDALRNKIEKYRDATNATKCFELLGKDMGMFTEKVEHAGNIKVETAIDEDRYMALARKITAFLSDPKLKK